MKLNLGSFQIDLSSPIKTLGEHEVRVKFSNDISGSFKLTIEKED